MTTPSSLPPLALSTMINYATQRARQNHLEALYFEDGRDNPQHPMHGLYTGLAVMERWREDCRATPLLIGLLRSMLQRHKLHLAAGDYNSARREYEALSVFLREGR